MKTAALYIDEQLTEIGDAQALRLSLSFFISDIKNVGERKAAISKTIDLPDTPSNRKIMGFPTELSSSDVIDQTVKKTARIEIDGSRVIKGFVKPISPVTDEFGGVIKVIFLGDNGHWKDLIRNRLLNGLDWTDQDHRYTAANQTTSETVGGGRKYVYPLVNYGQFAVGGTDRVAVEERLPALNISDLIKSIFNEAGYNLVSTFINGAFFSKLYLAFTGNRFRKNAQFKSDREFRAGAASDRTDADPHVSSAIVWGTLWNDLAFTDVTSSGFFDSVITFGYDENDSKYQADVDQVVSFTANIRMRTSVTAQAIPVPQVKFRILQTKPSGVEAVMTELNWRDLSTDFQVFTLKTSYRAVDALSQFKVQFAFLPVIPVIFTNPNRFFTISAQDTIFFNSVSRAIPTGETVQFSEILPDISQPKFLEGLKGLFNLHFYTDVETRTVYVEDWDGFYNDTEEDWTSLLDHSRNMKIQYLGDNLARKIRYRYKDDPGDGYVREFQDNNNTILAMDERTIANQWAKDGILEQNNSLFAPTFMDTAPEIGFITAKIPKLWRSNGENGSPPAWSTDFLSRILYYDGVKSLPSGENWIFDDSQRNDYPYFYSVDEVTTNDNSLYFNDTYRSRGLFEKYHKQELETIDSSRLLRAYFRLSEVDISNLDFRKKYRIDIRGSVYYFRLNAVLDYAPLAEQTTLVELVTIPRTLIKSSSSTSGNVKPPGEESGEKSPPKTIEIIAGSVIMQGNNVDKGVENAILLGSGLTAKKSGQMIMGQGQDDQQEFDATDKFILALGEPSGVNAGFYNALAIDSEGNLRESGGVIFQKLDNLIVPTYYTDTNGNLQTLKQV